MEIDLHTLRKANREAAIRTAKRLDSWAIIVSDDPGNLGLEVARRLLEFGRCVHLVCPRCAENGIRLIDQEVHRSIPEIDDEVEVVAAFGGVDVWPILDEVGYRMELFGDVKAVWTGPGLADDRWAEDAHDFGFAVIMDVNPLDHL